MKKLSSVLVAAVAGLAVLQPVTAHADSYVNHDAAHDVVVIDDNGKEVKDPSRLDGDVLTNGVSYYGRRLGLSMSFSDLGHDTAFSGYLFGLKTNERKRFMVSVYAVPGEGWAANLMGRRGTVKCRGLAARVDYTANRVQATIPRRCLSAPRWVQVGAAALTGSPDETVYADVAGLNGTASALVFGPRVRRG
jgi:hypothetical protein